jgi:16S rRNA (uracil1498-N3)-methyltransferase
VRHRLFVTSKPEPGQRLNIIGDEFHHAARVTRVRENEEVEVFDGRGNGARAHVRILGKDEITVEIGEVIPSRESKFPITLAMAIINLDKFELVLQKGTELGVTAFIPMITERVEIRPERYKGKAERWEKIILEAVKQSGRSVIPPITPPMPFSEVIMRDGVMIFFDADLKGGALPAVINEATLLIGPEGGWSDDEIALAHDEGCIPRRLGPRRLRAETAAIIATAVVAARYGDI